MKKEKPTIRPFFAIDLPEVVKRDINEIIRQLQMKYERRIQLFFMAVNRLLMN